MMQNFQLQIGMTHSSLIQELLTLLIHIETTVPKVTDTISENLADLNVVKNVVVANAVTGKTSIDDAFKYYEEKGGYYVNAILEDLNSEENLAEEAKAQEAADAVENKSTQGN